MSRCALFARLAEAERYRWMARSLIRRFWMLVLGADALRGTTTGSALVRPLIAASNLDGWAMVERLLKDLALLEDRIWLVVDDVHELGSAEALRQLERLFDARAAGAAGRAAGGGSPRCRWPGDRKEAFWCCLAVVGGAAAMVAG